MQMISRRSVVAAGAAAFLVGGYVMFVERPIGAQQPPPQTPQPMSFFVTSVGMGDGANLGGLAGADKHCQTLAAAVGAGGKTWRAYLSTQGMSEAQTNIAQGGDRNPVRPPAPAVNARDRIGKGPWFNVKGARIAMDVGDLHGDTLDQARRGNNLTKQTALTEKGEMPPGVGDSPNTHDVLTGSQLDGTAFPPDADRTCRNWTSNTGDSAQLGHLDRVGGGNTSWNSAHASKGCSQQALIGTGGSGRFYCFAID
jgi:hypothetical protein